MFIARMVEEVIVPIERVMCEDGRVMNFFEDHDAKMRWYKKVSRFTFALLMSDFERMKAMMAELGGRHRHLGIDEALMREYLLIYFSMLHHFVSKHLPKHETIFNEKFMELKESFMHAFLAKEQQPDKESEKGGDTVLGVDESEEEAEFFDDDFFDFDAEESMEAIDAMHYEEHEKIDVAVYMQSGEIDHEAVDELEDCMADFDLYEGSTEGFGTDVRARLAHIFN